MEAIIEGVAVLILTGNWVFSYAILLKVGKLEREVSYIKGLMEIKNGD